MPNPHIRTELPGPRARALLARDANVISPSYPRDYPFAMSHGRGTEVWDVDGNRFLDFASGIAVCATGHAHPQVVDAVKQAAEKFLHISSDYWHENMVALGERLAEVAPMGEPVMSFLCQSGTESVEGALKLARYVTGRPGIIAFDGGFHGRTYGAASVTSVKAKYRNHYEPFVPSVYFAPYAYPYRCPLGEDETSVLAWSLGGLQKLFERQILPAQVAAILVEPVQGEGGYIVPPQGFLKGLREICDQHGILLILDEVQTGFGRTGQMFAAQTFDVQPDIMSIAKGIANGFPLGATVASRELMSQWKAGSHGTTFGGNPIACAAALATLEVIREENMLENCRSMGERFLDGFRQLKGKCPVIGDVRGVGLMVALELIVPGSNKTPNPEAATKVLEKCLERGLLGYMAGLVGQVIRFIPPLNVTASQVDEALAILDDSLGDI